MDRYQLLNEEEGEEDVKRTRDCLPEMSKETLREFCQVFVKEEVKEEHLEETIDPIVSLNDGDSPTR